MELWESIWQTAPSVVGGCRPKDIRAKLESPLDSAGPGGYESRDVLFEIQAVTLHTVTYDICM